MRVRTDVLFSILLCGVMVPGVVAGTTLLHRSPEQLGQTASLVVRGTVENVTERWNGDGTKILTEVEISVAEEYKGEVGPELRVVQLGGTVGHVRMNVSGALQWVQDDEVLLFLAPADQGRYRVEGFSQGRFHIKRDPSTGRAYVTRGALEGVRLLSATSARTASGVAARIRVPLNEFLQTALEREGGAP